MEVGSRILAGVVRRFLPLYRRKHGLSAVAHKALRAIVRCKTPALGGHEYQCERCGARHHIYHGCRNRHCPQCQGIKTLQWLEKQQAKLLPIDYYQAVFTVASELWLLLAYNRRLLYGLLFAISSSTLQAFAADPRWLGAKLGLTGVLHTWGQQLAFHPHIHFIVTGGGVDSAGRWVWPRQGGHFLLPVVALSQAFKEKFLAALRRLHEQAKLEVPPGLDVAECLRQAALKKWEIFLQPPVAGPEKLLRYLGRYTHKVAISPARILDVDDRHVTFAYRDYRQGGVAKKMVLPGEEFLGRFVQHVLPEGFRRIRQYGLLCGARPELIDQIREQLRRRDCALLAALIQCEQTGRPRAWLGPPCPHCGQPMRMGQAIPAPRMDSS